MVTAAFIKFILGLFLFCLLGAGLCVAREWIEAMVEYADKQTQKKLSYNKTHKVADTTDWVAFYFGE